MGDPSNLPAISLKIWWSSASPIRIRLTAELFVVSFGQRTILFAVWLLSAREKQDHSLQCSFQVMSMAGKITFFDYVHLNLLILANLVWRLCTSRSANQRCLVCPYTPKKSFNTYYLRSESGRCCDSSTARVQLMERTVKIRLVHK